MPATKPRIRYYGCDMRWMAKFATIMADLAEVTPKGKVGDFAIAAIDADRNKVEETKHIVNGACCCGTVVVIIIPRGVTENLKNIAAEADGEVHFVTGRENLNLVRNQMERILGELND